jgi:hypothetical protein
MRGRNFLDDLLRFPGGLEITVFIREANDTISVRDINPLRIWSRGIEGDSKRLV